MYRGVIGASIVYSLAHVSADKKGIVSKVSGHFRSDIVSAPKGKKMHDFDIAHERRSLQKRVDQSLWFAAPGLDIHAHSGLHATQGLLRRLQFRLIVGRPQHGSLSSSDGTLVPHCSPSSFGSFLKRRFTALCPISPSFQRSRVAMFKSYMFSLKNSSILMQLFESFRNPAPVSGTF